MANVLNLNIRWSASAQQPNANATAERIKEQAVGMARLAVRDVAIAASERYYQESRRALERSIEKSVRAEADRMARSIAHQMPTQEKRNGPYGTLTLRSDDFGRGNIEGNDSDDSAAHVNVLSQTARATWGGGAGSFDMHKSGIKWAPRSAKYLRQKKREGKGGGWWKHGGGLTNWFRTSARSSFFERAFGPIKVMFRKAPKGASRGDWATHRVTPSGAGGRISTTVTVGRVEVIAFGRITPSMLPALASGRPEGTGPGKGAGVAGLLGGRFGRNKQVMKLLRQSTTRSEKFGDVRINAKDDPNQELAETRKKLWGKTYRMQRQRLQQKAEYRQAIDPFVSFYMTRALPNAVWRRIERTARPDQGNSIQNVRSSGY